MLRDGKPLYASQKTDVGNGSLPVQPWDMDRFVSVGQENWRIEFLGSCFAERYPQILHLDMGQPMFYITVTTQLASTQSTYFWGTSRTTLTTQFLKEDGESVDVKARNMAEHFLRSAM